MICLNTRRGTPQAGENGLAAVVGRQEQARADIDEAIAFGARIGARMVHVMAGRSDRGHQSEQQFRTNLAYACKRAALHEMNVVIEPLNHRDAPGYHLTSIEQAVETIRAVGMENLKVMFDCYHLQIMQGDLINRLKRHFDVIGHIQIAAVPDRGPPDGGEVNYRAILSSLKELGWRDRPVGAEYIPTDPNDTAREWIAWQTALECRMYQTNRNSDNLSDHKRGSPVFIDPSAAKTR